MSIITLLTDFGSRDSYVGAVKGVLSSLAPGAPLIDLSHEVPPGDVDRAAFVLAAAAREFPAGTVHLAVVDPGVGSERRILAASAAGQYYVAPDNGLLTPLRGEARFWNVERRELFRTAPGETFHGRDCMAPVAAYLARGEPIAELGPEITDPLRRERPAPRREPQALVGHIVHIDRFGNLITDLPNDWQRNQAFRVELGPVVAERWVTHYAELAPGEVGLLAGSGGTLELSLCGESLAARCGQALGDRVTVVFRLQ
jgi:S-adenosyl-L-methionine hydrolase (adenosine-forming)